MGWSVISGGFLPFSDQEGFITRVNGAGMAGISGLEVARGIATNINDEGQVVGLFYRSAGDGN